MAMTKKEKKLRAEVKKQLQAEGLLPPDKPRLNRKAFYEEVEKEFKEEMNLITDWPYLLRAVIYMSGDGMRVTPEQLGILKAKKIAVNWKRYERKLADKGESEYSIKEAYEQVIKPVIEL